MKLREVASKGLIYSISEKLLLRGGQFAIGIILANLLSPADFGTIAILTFFLGISHILVDSGFGKALIQKTNNTSKDYSTTFIFNLVISIILYLFLYIGAPFIADFYDNISIIPLLRILGLAVIIEAFSLVPRVKLNIDLNFKKIAIINVTAVIISGICAIAFAIYGLGIWSLVLQHIMRVAIETILYIVICKWKPELQISVISFKQLYKFGSHILLANIYAEIVNNISKLFIGKAYSSAELGYYTRAKNLTALSADTLSQAIQTVMFPVLSKIKDDKEKLLKAHKEIINVGAYFSIPFITLLSLIADPLIRIMFNDQWLEVIPLLQITALSRLLFPQNSGNLNMLNVIGRSDLYLKVNLIKLPLIIISLIITLPIGIKALVIGQLVCSILYHFINAYWIGKIFNYGAFKQLLDIRKTVLATVIMYVIVYQTQTYIDSSIWKLIVSLTAATASYIVLSQIFKIKEYKKAMEMARNILSKN